jgi:hypothetical protein
MGAPAPEMNTDMHADDSSAEVFTGALRTISPPEPRKHASVYNYWLSIKRDRQFPPIRDLDPLEISDAGPFSLLLEMVGGGEDAGIRHIGHAIQNGPKVEKVGEAPNPSLLSCIAARLPVVAGCRDAFAFEDEFETADGKTRCWVTLLPFSATGSWIDYVYGFVTLDTGTAEAEAPREALEEAAEPDAESIEERVREVIEEVTPEQPAETAEVEPVLADEAPEPVKPSFSEKLLGTLANVGGFYGRPVEIELDPETVSLETWEADDPAPEESAPPDDPVAEEEDAAPADEAFAAEEPVEDEAPAPEASTTEPNPQLEGNLESKLTEVRAKADEARQAKLRANSALYEGLSAAYDFALDAEDAPEEYLKLVQAEGLKIQLRSPMKPVAKLAFDGMCDDMTIQQLEAILAWAFDEELPRGTLAGRIEEQGGIAPILSGQAKAA